MCLTDNIVLQTHVTFCEYLVFREFRRNLYIILFQRNKRNEITMTVISMDAQSMFWFWFDRESVTPGNLGFAISVCRLRERGRMSKSVYVRVVHDSDLLCSSLCDRTTALISRWDE